MISIAVAPLTSTFLVAIRIGTVLLFSPIEAIRQLPIHTRLLLVLTLSILVASHVPEIQIQPDNLSLLLSGITEFCNGLILSLSLYATFATFQISGQLIDAQMGFNSLAILNPSDHSHDPLSGRLLVMLAVLFFFAIDGHHKLVQALIRSFVIIPPGELSLFHSFGPMIQQCSLMFAQSLMIASPIVFALMTIELIGGVFTRNMPQVSTYFLTVPIKILLGYIIFGLLLNYINPLIEQVFQKCFSSFNQVMS